MPQGENPLIDLLRKICLSRDSLQLRLAESSESLLIRLGKDNTAGSCDALTVRDPGAEQAVAAGGQLPYQPGQNGLVFRT